MTDPGWHSWPICRFYLMAVAIREQRERVVAHIRRAFEVCR